MLGYETHLYYYWLDSPEMAIRRVALRVKSGGHFVPDATIRQRYARSAKNFFELYQEHADWWEVYDNTYGQRELIGCGQRGDDQAVEELRWSEFRRSAGYDSDDTN